MYFSRVFHKQDHKRMSQLYFRSLLILASSSLLIKWTARTPYWMPFWTVSSGPFSVEIINNVCQTEGQDNPNPNLFTMKSWIYLFCERKCGTGGRRKVSLQSWEEQAGIGVYESRAEISYIYILVFRGFSKQPGWEWKIQNFLLELFDHSKYWVWSTIFQEGQGRIASPFSKFK